MKLTYRVDCNASCKVQILFAVGIPHSDALSMSKDNVRPHIRLQHISAGDATLVDVLAGLVGKGVYVSLLLSFDHVTCEGCRVLYVGIGTLLCCS